MANMVEVKRHRSSLHKGISFSRCTKCKTGWMKESSLVAHKTQCNETKKPSKDNKLNTSDVIGVKQVLVTAPADNQPESLVTIEGHIVYEDKLMDNPKQNNSTLNNST